MSVIDFDSDVAQLRSWSADIDRNRVLIGLLVANRMDDKSYGDKTVEKLSEAIDMRSGTLYEYAAIARFVRVCKRITYG